MKRLRTVSEITLQLVKMNLIVVTGMELFASGFMDNGAKKYIRNQVGKLSYRIAVREAKKKKVQL